MVRNLVENVLQGGDVLPAQGIEASEGEGLLRSIPRPSCGQFHALAWLLLLVLLFFSIPSLFFFFFFKFPGPHRTQGI